MVTVAYVLVEFGRAVIIVLGVIVGFGFLTMCSAVGDPGADSGKLAVFAIIKLAALLAFLAIHWALKRASTRLRAKRSSGKPGLSSASNGAQEPGRVA